MLDAVVAHLATDEGDPRAWCGGWPPLEAQIAVGTLADPESVKTDLAGTVSCGSSAASWRSRCRACPPVKRSTVRWWLALFVSSEFRILHRRCG
jgi:hypothetical protein